MRRSPTDPKPSSRLFTVGIIVLVLISALAACNITIQFFKDRLTHAAAEYFAQRVTVDSILYLPPNFIFFKNLSMIETVRGPERQIIVIPLSMVKFSTLALLIQGKLLVTDLCLWDTRTDYAEFREFIKHNFRQIMTFLLDLPQQDIRLSVKGTRMHLAPENGGPAELASYLFLKIQKDSVFGYGAVSRDMEGKVQGIPLEFIFRGEVLKGGFAMESLEIMRENFYAKLWGATDGPKVKIHGFSFINTGFTEHAYYDPYLTVRERAENFLRGFPAPPKSSVMPKVDLFLLDIESTLDLRLPKVTIDELKFTLNNNPMSLTGSFDFSWQDPIKVNLAFKTTFSHFKHWSTENLDLKEIKAGLQGEFKDLVYSGNADIYFDFIKKQNAASPVEEFSAKLEGMIINASRFPRLTATIRALDIFTRTGTHEYKLLADYFGSALDFSEPRAPAAQFSARFYDGMLKGKARFDTRTVPAALTADLRIRNATAVKLDHLVEHFAKVHGKLSGQLRFSNQPDIGLKGSLTVAKGFIEKFEFLKWLSEFFSMESLQRIDFPRAKANFKATAQGAGLKDIQLNSGNLFLGGSFHLGTNDMVTSRLSLTFTKELMERSAKLRPLLRLVGKDISTLTFDFRLSGNLHNMNFLWLESDFKKKLRGSIPGFLERALEKQIEQSLAPLTSAQ